MSRPGKAATTFLRMASTCGGRVPRRYRKILPVRQDMDGDEIDRRRDVPIAQPELPDVGVGHRHRHLRLDLTDGLDKSGSRHFAPQQDFVADDHRLDHIRKSLGERDPAVDLLAGELRDARQPQALHHLDTVALGDLRDLVEAMVGRIGAHAVGDALELDQVGLDLPGVDRDVGPERVLTRAERGVGNAVELRPRRQRRVRHLDRGAEPSPGRDDRQCCKREQRSRKPHRQPRPSLIPLRLSCWRGTAKRRPRRSPAGDAATCEPDRRFLRNPYWRRAARLL